MCAALVFIAALALYTVTLAPSVTLVDSGELIAAAHSLGVAHPPGFPLYILLTHIATLVPIGSIAQRANFASALFAALASGLLTLLVFEATACASLLTARRRKAEKRDRHRQAKQSVESVADLFEKLPERIVLATGLLAGLMVAFSRTLWAYATIAEVYALNTLLIVTIFFLMMRWRRHSIENLLESTSGATSDRDLLIAAFLFGLAMGVHHVTIALMLPALAVLVFKTAGAPFFISKRLARAVIASSGGLLIYAYLPLAASRNPLMNWGDPRTFERLWWHVTGRQYQEFLSFSITTMKGQFTEFLMFAFRETGPWWLPVGLLTAVAGLICLFRFDRATFWFVSLVALVDVAYALNYDIAEDTDAYYLPVFLGMAIASSFGLLWLARLLGSRPRLSMAVTAVLVVAIPSFALASNFAFNNRSRYHIAEDYVANILSTIKPNGMLLTRDWQVYSPFVYFHEIERRRTDVVAIDINQLRRSWYFDYLRRAYPELIEKSRDKVEAYVADLRDWEADPDSFNANRALVERINQRFVDMVTSLVSHHIERAPVYATEEFITSPAHRDGEVTRALKYTVVPQGLVFELTRQGGFHQPVDLNFRLRGLADRTLKFEEDDVVRRKVLPAYVKMLTNRGLYLATYERHEQAMKAYTEALALDANHEDARRGLAESRRKLQGGPLDKSKIGSPAPHVEAEDRGRPEAGATAGEIFGVPVGMGNYYFAKRVAHMFPRPWGAADLPAAEREQVVWDNLILHFEGFRQGITVTEDELDATVNDLLKDQRQSFRRRGDPEAYRRWVKETLQEDVELFESQIRYVVQIRKLKDQVLQQQRVTVTEEEMRQEFLSDQHHVGGELVVFATKNEAEAFYRVVKDPNRWDAMKARGTPQVRPMSPMTLSAIIDLWGVPREQIQALHAMPLGSVGPPVPFGRQWGVLRLLDKRTGDLLEFPKERARYVTRVERKKKYQALEQWIAALKQAAHPKILVSPP